MRLQKVLQEIQEEGKALQEVSKAMIGIEQENLQYIFNTSNTSLHQCDSSEQYILCFQGSEVKFRACELIAFKRKIQKLDLTTLLSSDAPDIEILHMPSCDRFFVLTIYDVLELRELFAGAFAMLELNSLIHKEIIRKGC